MHSILPQPPLLSNSSSKVPDFHGAASRALLLFGPAEGRWTLPSGGKERSVTMRDRSKNRKPTQRGRYLSIEGIQAVQALKRANVAGGEDVGESLRRVLNTKVLRLVKLDMVSVLRELLRQGESLLALQVFEEIRNEHWYKPQLSIYVEMITVLAGNGLHEKVEEVWSCLKMERLESDTEGFNALLRTLLEFGFTRISMDCLLLIKLWETEPDESTFRILINGLELNDIFDLFVDIKEEAHNFFGRPLEFPQEEEVDLAGVNQP